MNEFIDKYIKQYEALPKLPKFLIHLLWAIPTNLYRIAKSIKKEDMLGALMAILLLCFGGCILFTIIDIITILLYNRVYFIDFEELTIYYNDGEKDVNTYQTSKNTSTNSKPADNNGNPDKID